MTDHPAAGPGHLPPDNHAAPAADGWAVLEQAAELTRRGDAFALATVGSPAAVVNAVVDALAPHGVRHIDMPLTPAVVWRAIQGRPLRTDLAIP